MTLRWTEQLLADSVDEAADLFVRRCQRLNPPEAGLHHVLEGDLRLDAHLDVLFYGGGASLQACMAATTSAPAALYAGARTAVRQGRLDDWQQLAEAAGALPPDPDRLAQGEPTPWQCLLAGGAHEPWPAPPAALQAALQVGGESPLAEALAYAAGYQRWAVGPALAAALTAGVKSPAVWLWALGQVGESAGRAALVAFLEHMDPAIARAAALALCRTEDDHVAGWLAAQALNQLWAPVVLSMLGGPRAARMLAKHIETVDAYAVMAAGLLGDGALVPSLLGASDDPQLAPTAAQALHLITGLAPLEEDPEPPTQLEEHEQHVRQAEASARPRGLRLAQSSGTWKEALAAAQVPTMPGVRLRFGEPARPLHTVVALRSPHLKQEMRALLIDELYVRYGLGVHVRADQHAARQMRVLDKLAEFLPHMAPQPQPGAFAFQGRASVAG